MPDKHTCAACGNPAAVEPATRKGLKLSHDLKGVWFCWSCFYEYAIRMGWHLSKQRPGPHVPIRQRSYTLTELTDRLLKQWFHGFNPGALCRMRPGATYEALPLEFYIDLLARQGYCCALTGKSVALSLDHIVPLAEGGDHTPDNLRFIDHALNTAKGAAMLNPNRLDRTQETGVCRITANERALKWFTNLSARERGALVERLYRED